MTDRYRNLRHLHDNGSKGRPNGDLDQQAIEMKIIILGKRGSLTRWTEETNDSLRHFGHKTLLFPTRNPLLSKHLESKFLRCKSDILRIVVNSFKPDLILAVGADWIPAELLQTISAMPSRPPIFGWVGEIFAKEAEVAISQLDLVGYTDSDLVSLHHRLQLKPKAIYIPHAAATHYHKDICKHSIERRNRMVFVGAPATNRREIVAQIKQPILLAGPGWRDVSETAHHDTVSRYVTRTETTNLYKDFALALNIKNASNVINGLNQRNFAPLACGAALITDRLADLENCFDVEKEIFVYENARELNDIYNFCLRNTTYTSEIAARGQARVLIDHNYQRRLESIIQSL